MKIKKDKDDCEEALAGAQYRCKQCHKWLTEDSFNFHKEKCKDCVQKDEN